MKNVYAVKNFYAVLGCLFAFSGLAILSACANTQDTQEPVVVEGVMPLQIYRVVDLSPPRICLFPSPKEDGTAVIGVFVAYQVGLFDKPTIACALRTEDMDTITEQRLNDMGVLVPKP